MEVLRPTAFAGESGEVVESDFEFLRVRVPFLTTQGLAEVEVIRPLSEGSFGRVSIVSCNGQKAIKKVLKCEQNAKQKLWEARVTAELNGAGGAPRLLAVCADPPAVLLAYAGRTFEDFIQYHCTAGGFLNAVVRLTELLSEIHCVGFLHNDLKGSNVMLRGPNPHPTFHIIDFGMASRVGHPFNFLFFGMDRILFKRYCSFRSPEMGDGLPLGPPSDVFSLGVLIKDMLNYAKFPLFNKLLAPLLARCALQNPAMRPTLPELATEINVLKTKVPDKLQRKRLENIRSLSVNPKKGKARH